MRCPNCGAPAKGRFCEYCGTEVNPPSAGGVTVNINLGESGARNAGATIPQGYTVNVSPNGAYGSGAYGANAGASGSYGSGSYDAGPRAGHASSYAAGYAAGHADARRDGYGYGRGGTVNYVQVSHRSWLVALMLCLFVGYFGAHYFYVGRWGMGALYLFTGGLFGIGWLVDIVRILIGSFRDDAGLPLSQNAVAIG